MTLPLPIPGPSPPPLLPELSPNVTATAINLPEDLRNGPSQIDCWRRSFRLRILFSPNVWAKWKKKKTFLLMTFRILADLFTCLAVYTFPPPIRELLRQHLDFPTSYLTLFLISLKMQSLSCKLDELAELLHLFWCCHSKANRKSMTFSKYSSSTIVVVVAAACDVKQFLLRWSSFFSLSMSTALLLFANRVYMSWPTRW